MANKHLGDAVKVILDVLGDRELEANNLIGKVCEARGVLPDVLLGRTRRREISALRFVVEYLFREMYKLPYKEICELTGGLHHASVIYGVRRISEYLREMGGEREVRELFNSFERGKRADNGRGNGQDLSYRVR